MHLPMKDDILLVGYGAVGVIYSYILERSGKAQVTAVARGNYEIASGRGINIQSVRFGGRIANFKPHRVVKSVSEALDRPYKYVVVATKALPDVLPTAQLLAPILLPSYNHPLPTIVLLQNGIGVERDLYDHAFTSLGKRLRIIAAAVYILTNLNPVGDEVIHDREARIDIGLYHPLEGPRTEDPDNSLISFHHMVMEGGGGSKVFENIQPIKYHKNMWNAGFATVASLTRHPVPALFTSNITSNHQSTLKGVISELALVGRALGYTESQIPATIVDDIYDTTKALFHNTGTQHKASMLLDVQLGKPFEVEVTLGEVVRHAHRLGVPIPRLETMYLCLSVMQEQTLRSLPARSK
ncbi:hypothetical protein FRC02_006577 [Tulasnella sp. 418]|nr:hypothetical protein FRC02_006577 [Tulasnella sp. 418]